MVVTAYSLGRSGCKLVPAVSSALCSPSTCAIVIPRLEKMTDRPKATQPTAGRSAARKMPLAKAQGKAAPWSRLTIQNKKRSRIVSPSFFGLGMFAPLIEQQTQHGVEVLVEDAARRRQVAHQRRQPHRVLHRPLVVGFFEDRVGRQALHHFHGDAQLGSELPGGRRPVVPLAEA